MSIIKGMVTQPVVHVYHGPLLHNERNEVLIHTEASVLVTEPLTCCMTPGKSLAVSGLSVVLCESSHPSPSHCLILV